MKPFVRILIVAIVLAAVVGVIIAKKSSTTPAPAAAAADTKKLPRLLELGADKCIPCKAMAPIIDELKKTNADKLQVDFIDVWKNEQAMADYKIETIPTQIFFDASGKELWRHQGFLPKEEILAKWKEFGLNLAAGQ